MNETKSKYRVDKQQIDEYLRRRFISFSITAGLGAIIVFSMLAFIFYKQGATDGLWSFSISVPLCVGAFLFGMKLWNDKLRALADTEFVLTFDSIIQTSPNKEMKNFKFSDIAVISRKKLGTMLVKGSWLTKIDYYRPKKTPYQLGDLSVIFIPTITTNYSELIEAIQQSKRLD